MTSPLLAHWNCLKQLCLKMLHKTSQDYGRWNAANHLHQCERTRERFGLSLIRFYFACSIIFEVADQRQGTCPKQMGPLPQLRSVYPKQLLKIHLDSIVAECHQYLIYLNCTVLNCKAVSPLHLTPARTCSKILFAGTLSTSCSGRSHSMCLYKDVWPSAFKVKVKKLSRSSPWPSRFQAACRASASPPVHNENLHCLCRSSVKRCGK